MQKEPKNKRAICFFDGQNLFHSAKQAFGYTYPNYDVKLLSEHVCNANNWELEQARFYTGIPDETDSAHWHHFWVAKGAQMGREGVNVFTRPLKYRNKEVKLSNGCTFTFLDGEEKGIDVRLALDVIRLAHRKLYDVAVIFSRDQDLSEVADEIRLLAKDQSRWIMIASAYPYSPTVRSFRGVDKTNWIKILRPDYDKCIDKRDYRPKQTPKAVEIDLDE